jgi:hypothetical protein
MKRLLAGLLALAGAISVTGVPQFVPADRVGDLLAANGLQRLQDVPLDVRQMYIGNGSFRFYDAARRGGDFFFAGHLLPRLPRNGDVPIDDKIHVVWANTDTQQARYTALSVQRSGSISSVSFTKDHVYVSAHLSPSAENTLVITRDLKLQHELNGYPRKVLADGTLVFHNSQIHFAPTHIAELSAYDPVRQIERKIYPPANPDPVRKEFVSRVRAAYVLRGESWFRINNHHMNAERFDSSLGELEADEGTHTIAFLIRYQNPINDADDPRTSGEHVVATCTSMNRVDQITCKERSLDAWTNALKLSKSTILNDRGDSQPGARELLRRAAATPDAVP